VARRWAGHPSSKQRRALAALLLLPVWTLNYWQAWGFIVVFWEQRTRSGSISR
jgi:hypothetical protein